MPSNLENIYTIKITIMGIQFTARIKKGNKAGTGFFYIPKNKINLINLGDKINVYLKNKQIEFFAKIIKYHKRFGVYIPRSIVTKNDLLGKEVKVKINKIKGFYSIVGSDGSVYIPTKLAQQLELKVGDIILIESLFKNSKITRYSKVNIRKKRNTTEYKCNFDYRYAKNRLIFKIKKLNKSYSTDLKYIPMDKILKDMNFAITDKDKFIIYKGNKIPAIIRSQLKYEDLAYYLGAYFSDGTKTGNSWGICASTFKQAEFYLKMHNFLISNSKPELTISFTNIIQKDEEKIKKWLKKGWKKRVNIKVDKFRIIKPKGKRSLKHNKYGTLVIREHRQILLDFYNSLLNSLIKEILSKKDRRLAIDFICGVLEGDGSVSAKKQGHITIHTNKYEYQTLKDVIDVSGVKSKVCRAGENKYSIRIGALELLRNFSTFKEKIFAFYPERRRRLYRRLNTVGAVKFLIGDHKPTAWVKTWLKNNGFVNEEYQLTEKGVELRNELVKKINDYEG